jgi:hypothetical protein
MSPLHNINLAFFGGMRHDPTQPLTCPKKEKEVIQSVYFMSSCRQVVVVVDESSGSPVQQSFG